MDLVELIKSQPIYIRILAIIIVAALVHFIIHGLQILFQYLLSLGIKKTELEKDIILKRYPKVVTISTITISAFTFTTYFLAVGFILQEFDISLTAYLASASVIGLAIGFGAQGFVQDLVIGLTLIFSDTLDIGDVVEISGQIGKVDKIGLRFTTLINLHGQLIYIPNRNIAAIGQFRRGCVRSYVDIQIPKELNEVNVSAKIESVGLGMYQQHKSIILTPPEVFGIEETDDGAWRYLRIKFRVWPGQTALIENTFKQRVLLIMKENYPSYNDWMITVTNKVE